MYNGTIKGLFEKIPVEISKPKSLKEKCQSLLHDIRGEWYTEKINEKLPPINKRKLSKKEKEEENRIKINI